MTQKGLRDPQGLFCLATVATPNFLEGAEVLVASFLQNHPWFKGDIRLIGADLNAAQLDAFRRLHKHTAALPISTDLAKAIASDLFTEIYAKAFDEANRAFEEEKEHLSQLSHEELVERAFKLIQTNRLFAFFVDRGQYHAVYMDDE